MRKIEVQELDLNNYLTLNVFKEFSDFKLLESDFDDFPDVLEKAKDFWDYKNTKRSSSKPYNLLETPADYAAVIFMKNDPSAETSSSLSDKRKEIIEQAKIFVEILVNQHNYGLEELLNIQKEAISEKVIKTIS